MTLSGEEFLRRFVRHVLPRGFVKVRHYGFLANRHREEKLKLCRQLLVAVALAAIFGTAAPLTPPAAAEASTCPKCGGRRFVRLELVPGVAVADTS